MDRQDSRRIATGSRLLATSARCELVRGLSLFVSGTYGDRDQMLGDVVVGALTRNVQAGATYRIGVRWVDANVGYSRGLGSNTTADGRIGDIRSWTGQAGLSVSLLGLTVGGGYDRAESRDEILEFGNYDNRRWFFHAQTEVHGLMIMSAWDSTWLERGRDLTLSHARQQTFTASASSRVGREGRVTASAGGFSSRADFGDDRTRFWGGTFEAPVTRRLVFTVSVRYEQIRASVTELAQEGLGGFVKLGYHVRLFDFALEYQHNEQNLRYASTSDRHSFRGHQLMLRISRKFGIRM